MSSQKKIDVFSFLGWVMGGLSLLNLIEDLTPLKLLGKLKKWMDAYTTTIEQIRNVLFGWIDFWWVNISELEIHALIIGLVIVSAYFRAEIKSQKEKGRPLLGAIAVAFFASSVNALTLLAPALILPTRFGLLGIVIVIVYICSGYFHPDVEGKRYASRKIIVSELTGVVTVFMLSILLNYTLFSST